MECNRRRGTGRNARSRRAASPPRDRPTLTRAVGPASTTSPAASCPTLSLACPSRYWGKLRAHRGGVDFHPHIIPRHLRLLPLHHRTLLGTGNRNYFHRRCILPSDFLSRKRWSFHQGFLRRWRAKASAYRDRVSPTFWSACRFRMRTQRAFGYSVSLVDRPGDLTGVVASRSNIRPILASVARVGRKNKIRKADHESWELGIFSMSGSTIGPSYPRAWSWATRTAVCRRFQGQRVRSQSEQGCRDRFRSRWKLSQELGGRNTFTARTANF